MEIVGNRLRSAKIIGFISMLLINKVALADNFASMASKSYGEKFSPRAEISIKGGNHRSIFRPGLLIPLHQDGTSLVHGSAFLMGDTTKSVEGNFGLGYRKRVGAQAFGGYGFYDIRRTTNKNVIHQATVGIEYLRSHMEFRANVYLPSTKKFVLNSFSKDNYRKADGHKRIEARLAGGNIFEQALRGFDVEIGGQLPGLEDLSARVAYYHFGFSSDKSISTKQGVRFGLSYSILDMLSIDGEYSYTANSEVKKDKHTVFGGLTFSYNFGKTKPSHQTRLERKMNSLPIRDIDIVAGKGKDSWDNQVTTADLDDDAVVIVLDATTGKAVALRLQGDSLKEMDVDAEHDAVEAILGDSNLSQDGNRIVITKNGRKLTSMNKNGGLTGDIDVPGSETAVRAVRDEVRKLLQAKFSNLRFNTKIEDDEQAAETAIKEFQEANRKVSEINGKLITNAQVAAHKDAIKKHQAEVVKLEHLVGSDGAILTESGLRVELDKLQESTEELELLYSDLANYRRSRKTVSVKTIGSPKKPGYLKGAGIAGEGRFLTSNGQAISSRDDAQRFIDMYVTIPGAVATDNFAITGTNQKFYNDGMQNMQARIAQKRQERHEHILAEQEAIFGERLKAAKAEYQAQLTAERKQLTKLQAILSSSSSENEFRHLRKEAATKRQKAMTRLSHLTDSASADKRTALERVLSGV